MANPFLTESHDEIETAIMLEKAYVTDIGNAVAYTDGKRLFVNTEDNLTKILPDYSLGMLKWLLWHERYHMELRHHDRFFRYLYDLGESETEEKFQVTKEEVNIIMDILVHDSLSKMFPELIETALTNLAQMRNRNSLGYTFTTFTLEEMLDEYRKYKSHEDTEEDEGDGSGDSEGEPSDDKDAEESKPSKASKSSKGTKSHGESKDDRPSGTKSSGEESESEPKDMSKDETKDEPAPEPEPEHDKTDWSKLKDIDSKEFISEDEGDRYIRQINELRRKKFRLGRLSQLINSLSTTVKQRTYAMPSTIRAGKNVILKGRKPGKTAMYVVFDASGSMGDELATFREIISKSIPQAMKCPCEWFSGYDRDDKAIHARYNKRYNKSTWHDYYKGTFKDIMCIQASGGYSDDGDRTIDLCFLAEQKGYTPIGVTDGGGGISHTSTVDQLKALKKTVIVTQSSRLGRRNQKIQSDIASYIHRLRKGE